MSVATFLAATLRIVRHVHSIESVLPPPMLSDPCAYLAPSPFPHIIKLLAPVHRAVASPGVNPVIRGDPKLPLSVGPARAAVS